MNDGTFSYDMISDYNSQFRPSTVHCQNTGLVNYFRRYFLHKVMSCFDISIPDTWARNYFEYSLFGRGHVAVFNGPEGFGVLCQAGSLSGYNVFYQPARYVFGNPVIGGYDLKIGEDCEVIKIFPDYRGLMDSIQLYADMMGLCVEGAGVNLVNSKLAYVFAAENKAAAESFKKLYDKIASGEPAAVIDKSLFNNVDGSPNWLMFTQNVGGNYITDKILNDMQTIDDQFDTFIGIPNANTQKRERMITDEVNANNIDTAAMPTVICQFGQESMDKANKMFGLDLKIKYRWEGSINADAVDIRPDQPEE